MISTTTLETAFNNNNNNSSTITIETDDQIELAYDLESILKWQIENRQGMTTPSRRSRRS
jgi:hypothetical protein